MTALDALVGKVHQADARHLEALPDRSIPVVITSPPYFGLKHYGDDEDELGRRDLDTYLKETREVFVELGRVLEPDGLVWWNVGDTRTGSGGAGGDYGDRGGRKGQRRYRQGETELHRGQWALVPHRAAIALQDDGWLVLADVTWSKGKVALKAGVPTLVTRRRPEDLRHVRRPGISSERIFLFARSLDARRRFRTSMLEEPGDVWTFPPDGDQRRPTHVAGNPEVRSAPFPDELVRRCLLPTTLPGEIVLDPFAGTGTTLRVAARHGRRAIGFDLYAGEDTG